ncbi:hypothetical protein LFE_2233 [Leptospirillum ferrooxidans C2-3]|uniref:Uncharacterized protein n=1 Tax=Leptospirillum ferrooxidans (strain C2-3) TaxID=1162668 RepID=I0IRK7_LEPFC|nr:hypothetical protein LFE_2233 [Leptospirillum ferrooxidans C2-3]
MHAQAAKIANVHFCGVATGQRNASFMKSSMLRLGDFPLITLDFSDLLHFVYALFPCHDLFRNDL